MNSPGKAFIKGRLGEERVIRYFQNIGYEILEKRFRLQPGEVDIIVRKDDVIVFVEVKSWDVLGKENLEHSINEVKKTRIKTIASLYLNRHPEFGDCRIRFDLVFLSGKTKDLDHWEHAF